MTISRSNTLDVKALYRVTVFAALALLSGCGGGGSPSTTATSSNPHNVPANPFPDATPAFSGSTAQATLTQDNALYYGTSVQRAMDLIAIVGDGIETSFTPPADNPPEILWESSSSQTTEGRLNSDGTAWVEETLSSPARLWTNDLDDQGSPDLNPMHGLFDAQGKMQVRYLTPRLSNPTHCVVSFYGAEFRAHGIDVVVTGTIDETVTVISNGLPPIRSGTYVANLSIQDKIGHTNALLKDFKVISTFTNGAFEPDIAVSVSGTYVDAKHGAVQISTANEPLHYDYAVSTAGPYNGGYFELRGATPASAYFGGLNFYFASVAFDPSGSGIPTDAQRYSWSTGQIDTTAASWAAGPVAIASITQAAESGTDGALDGRFSYSPAGKSITYAWSIELGPPGSRPHFDHPTSATPKLMLDQLGQYLVKLTVSDGANTSVDREVIVANDLSGQMGSLSDTKIGPLNVLGNVGQAITLDSRLHNNASSDLLTPGIPACTLVAPTGSSAQLAGSTTLAPSFTPDVDGYYLVSCSGPTAVVSLTTVVNVNEPYQFSPGVSVLPWEEFGAQFVPADLNSDGKQDFVFAWTDTVSHVMVATNIGDGQYTTQTFQVGLGKYAAIGDLNGDGLPDVAVDSGSKFDMLLQQAGGGFKLGTPVAITCTNPNPTSARQITVGKVASDSAASVFYAGSCTDGLRIYRNDGSGHFTAGSAFSNFSTAQVADVTGDGINDLLYLGITGPVSAEKLAVTVRPGLSDGSFDVATQYDTGLPGTGFEPKMEFMDFNNDGATDVVVDISNPADLAILDQQSGGLAAATTYDQTDASTLFLDAVGDIDGDGVDDLVYVDDKGQLSISLGQSNHSFGTAIQCPILGALLSDSSSIEGPSLRILDFNADGMPDLMFYDGGVVLLGERPGQ